ncbi:MAG: magnesium transporter, partial [Desulfohalobiaceae bacterium]
VDDENRLQGVVTVDDVINIIHEEASEDMQSMVGAGMDESTESPWLYSVKKRIPWLLLNMVNSAVAAYVVHLFEDNIAKITLLAVLMPVVANMAGNSGQQALAVMIRQMAVEKFERKKFWLGVLREARIGFTNGIMLGGTIFCVVWILTQNILLSCVVGAAMWIDMFVGCTAGASIPLMLHELGRDPAQASTIFLTTITDSVGFLSLLSLAGLVLLGT